MTSSSEISDLDLPPGVREDVEAHRAVSGAGSPIAGSPAIRLTVIEPPGGWPTLDLVEIWRYRDLLFQLIWRDISVRYRQSLVGPAWVVLKPLISVVIFTVIFGRVARLPSDGAPYPVFVLAAMIPWLYFAAAVSAASESIVAGRGLITKVYFPRLVLPLSSVVVGLVDAAVQLLPLALVMAWYQVEPTWKLLFLPLFLVVSVVVALSVSLWLTALNVKYRDVKQVVPFFVQAWMWLSPVVYSSSMVPERWRLIYGLNPMVGVIEGFRWAILGQTSPDWAMLSASLATSLVILLGGLYFFRKTERKFADII